MVKFYGYAKCSTCTKAKRYLEGQGMSLEMIDVTLTPPPRKLLQSLIKSGRYTIRDLFNRSGEMYRSMGIKDKMGVMSEPELLDLLARHGRLVKRPIVTDGVRQTVGFDEAAYAAIWR